VTLYRTAEPPVLFFNNGVHKFGRGTVGTSQVPVWDMGGLHTFNDTAVAYFLSSSDNGDDDDVVVQVIDGNGAQSEITTTLTGQTQVQIGTGTYVRAHRAFVDDTTAPAGDVYVAESDTLTAGVPDTQTKIKAKIGAGDNQTMQAIWHCPAGFKGKHVCTYLTGSTNGKIVIARLWRKPFGKVARIMQEFILADTTIQLVPGFAPDVVARDDWYITAEVDASTGTVDAGFDIALFPL